MFVWQQLHVQYEEYINVCLSVYENQCQDRVCLVIVSVSLWCVYRLMILSHKCFVSVRHMYT